MGIKETTFSENEFPTISWILFLKVMFFVFLKFFKFTFKSFKNVPNFIFSPETNFNNPKGDFLLFQTIFDDPVPNPIYIYSVFKI